MKAWVSALVVLAAVILQISLLPAWRPLGIVPNLVLVVLIASAIWRPATQSLALALSAGVILDFASAANFGLRLSFYTFIVLVVVAMVRLGVDFERTDILLLAMAAATLAFDLAVLSTVWNAAVNSLGLIVKIVLTELAVNLALAWSLRALLARALSERPSVVVSPSQRRTYV